MNIKQKPLGVPETKAVIQSQIEGLSVQQVAVVNRLRMLGIPDGMISSATSADPDSSLYEQAENAIISHLCGVRFIKAEEALLLLNGKKTCTY
jgi:hypothetical protein